MAEGAAVQWPLQLRLHSSAPVPSHPVHLPELFPVCCPSCAPAGQPEAPPGALPAGGRAGLYTDLACGWLAASSVHLISLHHHYTTLL